MLENFLDEVNRIVQLEPYQLSPLEIGFLRARRSYLTGDQLKKFELVLEMEKEESELKYGELKAKAKELGLTVKVGVKKVDLIKMIEEAEKIDKELKEGDGEVV